MPLLLDAFGVVPVYPREEHGDAANNDAAFARLFEVLEAGNSMGIFPEGISHAGSHLTRLKTGTARIALAVGARRRVCVTIVPCGLTYMHRHRFRSQALLHFSEPIAIDDEWLTEYAAAEGDTVRRLTARIADALEKVTLNAPDWETLRFIHAARRLYTPTSVRLTPGTYVELSRRFVERYLAAADDPTAQRLRHDVQNYQARLDLTGLKDRHLRQPIGVLDAWKDVLWRSAALVALLPLAIPGALLHLPVAWIAMTAGERLSDDRGRRGDAQGHHDGVAVAARLYRGRDPHRTERRVVVGRGHRRPPAAELSGLYQTRRSPGEHDPGHVDEPAPESLLPRSRGTARDPSPSRGARARSRRPPRWSESAPCAQPSRLQIDSVASG